MRISSYAQRCTAVRFCFILIFIHSCSSASIVSRSSDSSRSCSTDFFCARTLLHSVEISSLPIPIITNYTRSERPTLVRYYSTVGFTDSSFVSTGLKKKIDKKAERGCFRCVERGHSYEYSCYRYHGGAVVSRATSLRPRRQWALPSDAIIGAGSAG